MPENYILLERIELNASVSSVALNNIPQTGYTDLKIVCSTRTDYAGFLDLNMFLNGNASSGYSWRRLNGDGGSATSTNSTSAGVIPSPTLGTTATANTFASTEIYIPNYTSTTSKSVSIDGVTENNATTSYQSFTAGLSTLSTAITSVNFGLGAGNFVAGSTFSLYGIAALGTTPVIAPKAIGGNRIDNDGTYWYHTYTSSGSFTPLQGLTADVLVVAGGGGAGFAGAGGAGGLLAFTSQSLSAISYNCTIGGGGGGASGNPCVGSTNGVDSQFGSLTLVIGGGAGGVESGTRSGNSGGSGGGAGAAAGLFGGVGGAKTTGQGNDGASDNNVGGSYPGGGGGGASAAGSVPPNSTTGGNGGNGLTNALINTIGAATGLGQLSSGNYYFAGGGGAGVFSTSGATYGSAGLGGGGAGGFNGTAGTTNSGGGGGGSGSRNTGAAGGSGIIVVRYPIA